MPYTFDFILMLVQISALMLAFIFYFYFLINHHLPYIPEIILNYFKYMILRPIHVEKRGRCDERTYTKSQLGQATNRWLFVLLPQIMIWNLDTREDVLSNPVKILDAHKDVVLSMSFNTDGSLLATACRDKKIRLIDPRARTVLQVGWLQGF